VKHFCTTPESSNRLYGFCGVHGATKVRSMVITFFTNCCLFIISFPLIL